MTVTDWAGVPIQDTTGWALLTPNTNIPLTTVSQLGPYDINTVGSLLVTQGYVLPSGTGWTKV